MIRTGPVPHTQQSRAQPAVGTYIRGLLFSLLQLFLGIFQSLGVFIQLIFGSFQFFLQSYQLVFDLSREKKGIWTDYHRDVATTSPSVFISWSPRRPRASSVCLAADPREDD